MSGDTALVVGLGSIGILMAQALKAYGIQVAGCDLIEERIEFLKSLGIEAYDVREIPPEFKADGIFMTSGADKAVDTALKYVHNGGKILVFQAHLLKHRHIQIMKFIIENLLFWGVIHLLRMI